MCFLRSRRHVDEMQLRERETERERGGGSKSVQIRCLITFHSIYHLLVAFVTHFHTYFAPENCLWCCNMCLPWQNDSMIFAVYRVACARCSVVYSLNLCTSSFSTCSTLLMLLAPASVHIHISDMLYSICLYGICYFSVISLIRDPHNIRLAN